MGLFDKNDAPTATDPTATAAAQTGANVSTAIANSYMNNYNQETPTGNLDYSVRGTYDYTDPNSGISYKIPRWTATQTLTPIGQQTQDASDQSKLNLAQISRDQSAAISNLLSTPFSPNASTPAAGDVSIYNSVNAPQSSVGATTPFQQSYASGGAITRGFDAGGDITRSYGPQDNFSADRSRVEQGLYERMNPQLQIEQDRLRNQLANQGINYGSTAYTNAMDTYNRQANDARLAIIGKGGEEQQRLNEMANAQATFQNAAQQQGYTQAQGLAGFQNTAQQQAESQNAARAAFGNQAAQSEYDQAVSRGQFYNTAQNQALSLASSKFNAANTARNQSIQEQYQQRQEPINEITALMSGSQISSPNFISAQKSTIPTTDVAGLINQSFSQQNDLYKTSQSTWSDILGGALGATGKVLSSDVRVKENIVPMGSIISPKGKELPFYEFEYKGDRDDGMRHFGPMAQDVEKLDKKAVKTIGGVKHIKLDRMASIFGSD